MNELGFWLQLECPKCKLGLRLEQVVSPTGYVSLKLYCLNGCFQVSRRIHVSHAHAMKEFFDWMEFETAAFAQNEYKQ